MSDKSYYQSGAEGLGKPNVSDQTISENASLPNEANQELNGNEPVTKSELQSTIRELEQVILRKAQSHTDKTAGTLDKRIKAAQDEAAKAIGMLKSTGVSLTPEQEHNIRQSAVNQALVAAEDSSPVPERTVDRRDEELVNNEVRRIMKETGVYIDPEEANEAIGNVNSPLEFIRKFEDLARQKSNRPQAESRIPTLAPTTGKPAVVDTLQRQYQDEVSQILAGKHPTIRQGDNAAVSRMKAEYRKKGLNVY